MEIILKMLQLKCSNNLNEDKTLEHYSYIFNTSILDIGIRIIAISAEKENHVF